MSSMNGEEFLELKPYWKWLDKKLDGKPADVQTLQRRTMNTATTILLNVRNIEFQKLSYALYFICDSTETKTLAHLYESQLELAGAAPEKFVKGLHAFYNDVAAKLKKNGWYEDFFDFLTLATLLRCKDVKELDPDILTVRNCYYSLLLQQLEYIRPNKFDFTKMVAGISTTGELLTVEDSFPTLDAPSYEIEKAVRDNKIHNEKELQEMIQSKSKKYGFDFKSIEDIEQLNNVDRVFTNNVAAMSGYINEFNIDILPQKYFSAFVLPIYAIVSSGPSNEDLRDGLLRRNKMLPANGVEFDLGENNIILSATMKETFRDDKIIMLYRLDTAMGDLSGYYDTKEQVFYTVLIDADDGKLGTILENLILYLYSCATKREGAEMLASFSDYFCYTADKDKRNETYQIQVKMYLKGGKPQVVYKPYLTGSGVRKNDEKYESVERPIQGFVRKVGHGRTPSEEAVLYAQSLGLILQSDETYVRPFVRHVLKLREKKA